MERDHSARVNHATFGSGERSSATISNSVSTGGARSPRSCPEGGGEESRHGPDIVYREGWAALTVSG